MKKDSKLLIINSRKDQLSQSASLLSRFGYQVLISDSRLLGYKIAREKEPALIIQFINNVSELPSELTVSEISAIPTKLLVLDTQSFVTLEQAQNLSYTLRQGIRLMEQLPDLVTEVLEEGNEVLPEAFKNFQVLVVDDELMNRTYYEELIKSMGLKCDVCSDLETASNFIREKDYELVISDVLLGEHIGLMLAKVIADCNRKSAFMVVTGLSEFEFKEKFGDFKYSALLHKPVSPGNFQTTVKKLLTHYTISTGARSQEPVKGQSHYNPEPVFRLLKNNKSSIDEVMQNFALYLSEALKIIPSVTEAQHLKLLRKSFHDLGNLCYYFGAEVLFEMIGKYSGTHNEEQKLAQVPAIAAELKVVNDLHQEGMKQQ